MSSTIVTYLVPFDDPATRPFILGQPQVVLRAIGFQASIDSDQAFLRGYLYLYRVDDEPQIIAFSDVAQLQALSAALQQLLAEVAPSEAAADKE